MNCVYENIFFIIAVKPNKYKETELFGLYYYCMVEISAVIYNSILKLSTEPVKSF